LHFFTKNVQNLSPEEGHKLVKEDLRFTSLMDLLFQRLGELEIEYVITSVWALGICVSVYGLEMQAENKLKLLTIFNSREMQPQNYASIPALVFSITCFFNEDMNQLVVDTVERLSKIYSKLQALNSAIVDNMLDRLDIVNASTLLMGWGRSYMNNDEMLKKLANEIIKKDKQKVFFEEGAVSEVANIM
jgi:hypothetical protein